MCKYCDEDFKETYIPQSNRDHTKKIYNEDLDMYIRDSVLRIEHWKGGYELGYENEYPIKYCPMCGINLTKEEK